MRSRGWGRIQFISSESALNIPLAMVHYGVSKSAIQGVARGLAKVLAGSGEDAIAFSDASDYAANVELAEAVAPAGERAPPREALEKVPTPGVASIEDVAAFLGVDAARCVKTLVVQGEDPGSLIALVLRGDHQLNAIKAEKLPGVAAPLQLAPEGAVREACGAWHMADLIFPAELVVSELVSNVVEHARGAGRLLIARRGDGVHIAVADGSRVMPRMVETTAASGDPRPPSATPW